MDILVPRIVITAAISARDAVVPLNQTYQVAQHCVNTGQGVASAWILKNQAVFQSYVVPNLGSLAEQMDDILIRVEPDEMTDQLLSKADDPAPDIVVQPEAAPDPVVAKPTKRKKA